MTTTEQTMTTTDIACVREGDTIILDGQHYAIRWTEFHGTYVILGDGLSQPRVLPYGHRVPLVEY